MNDGSIFELIMLISFGFFWPITILKTLRSKTVKGVSVISYSVVLFGYISGIVYKLFFNYNYVVIFYIINAVMVSIQIILYFYYKNKENKNTPPEWV